MTKDQKILKYKLKGNKNKNENKTKWALIPKAKLKTLTYIII